jgi:2-amino-4-hydroxy-6-hydroxymethyldihydropteridine diphosphokinase
MPRAYIGLGSNVGNREAMLDRAIVLLDALDTSSVQHRAPYYETEPVGIENQAWFLNTAIEIETDETPNGLLNQTQSIERELGRQRRFSGGPREIDLDILLYENQLLSTERLTIPHPEMHRRRFVLVPMCEIVPDLIHPVLKRPLRSLLQALDDTKQVALLTKKS